MTDLLPRPRVLAITRDIFFLRNGRLSMPLLNLKKQGLIEDFFITNQSLFLLPDDFTFDVVWLQRVDNARLFAHLGERLGHHYLYDLDDLLIGRAAHLGRDLVHREVVLGALRCCRRLTVTSLRLMGLLEKYTQTPLAPKTWVCPNAFEFPQATRRPAKPAGIILTSSDNLALVHSQEAVLGAVAGFAEKHRLPVYYVGKEGEKLGIRLKNVINLGLIPYWHYHMLLAAMPPMIGVAPLETVGDQETLDFIGGKSDVKMLEFGGFGHPSVYSQAPPFVDTDLKAGRLADNTAAALREGMEAVFSGLWRRLAQDQRQVRELRNMDRVAAECWYPALLAARLDRPLQGKDLKFAGGKVAFLLNAFRHLFYSQDYLFAKRLQERLPPFLLDLVRRFF